MTANYFLKEIVMEGLSPKFDSEWKDVKLYTPLQSCQSLLNEHAECVAVEAFLKMASLPFQLVERPNVEYMSPSGEAPFLKLDNILVPGFDSIVEFVGKKGVRLSAGLTNTAKADLEAHIAFIEESLRGAELYMLWLDEATYTMVTKERYGIVFSWPLCSLLPKLKRRQVRQYLTDIGWAGKTMDEVVSLADRCFKSLSSLLGQKE
ncbi:hypothetical protein AB6A40_011182 [Gnathostoma spinigerum]|uniref:Mitochondrial outer membrane transport complex Sam37/metaxin N-terminal domain-containing protein n=1 Tax=Gnathostoma spinigerum TaxID=75299 RepID=A0ABD6EWY1_9BILA